MSNKKSGSSSKKQILNDHKRVGKRFIPPFLYKLGTLSEISWVDELLPELIWIGLIITEFGYHKGVNIALQLSKTAKSVHKTEICEYFAWISTFKRITAEEWIALNSKLDELGVLPNLIKALNPLLSLYTDSPLAPLVKDKLNPAENQLIIMKDVVQNMYPRREVFATRVESTALYFAFVADCLKVVPEISLANFPEVENYPNTEASQEIASSVRATLNTFYGIERKNFPSQWPISFWNRGLELEKCERISEYEAKHQE